jgi:hypothetical protein
MRVPNLGTESPSISEYAALAYAQSLWQLTNLLTGASFVEAILVLVTAATNRDLQVDIHQKKYLTIGVLIVAQAGFVVVVSWCHSTEIKILHKIRCLPEVVRAVQVVRRLQIAALVAICVFFIAVAVGGA